MGKKGGSNSMLKWALILGGGFLAFEFLTNKGGNLDFISKGLNAIGAKSNYVRGGVEWGDSYYY